MSMDFLFRPFRWLLAQSVAGLAKARIPASFLTSISFVLCIIAGIFFGVGQFPSAGLILVPAAVCDLLARPLAQRARRINFFGAFLKSVLHRYADLALFMGLLVYYSTVNRFLYALLTGVAMAGAVMVSYSQARAESLIDRCRVGFWERPERLGLMILGAVLNRVPVALLILAIGTNFTVIHRIYHTWKQTEGIPRRSASDSAVTAAKTAEQLSFLPHSESRNDARADGQSDSQLRDLLARAAKRGA